MRLHPLHRSQQVAAPVLLVALLTAGCGYVKAEVRFRDPSRVSLRSADGVTLLEEGSPASVILMKFPKAIRPYDVVVERRGDGAIISPGNQTVVGQVIVDVTGEMGVLGFGWVDPVPMSMLDAPEAVIPLCWYEQGSRTKGFRAEFDACSRETPLRVYLVSPWDNVDLISKTFGWLWSSRERVEVVYGTTRGFLINPSMRGLFIRR